jgi:hypothetical protein
MCFLKTPSMPSIPDLPPPAADPKQVNEAAQGAREKERKRIAAAAGRTSTQRSTLLSPTANTKKATLLGG